MERNRGGARRSSDCAEKPVKQEQEIEGEHSLGVYLPALPKYENTPDSEPEALRERSPNRIKNSRNKEFRCPFKLEDGRNCNDKNDSISEEMNHFMKHHAARFVDTVTVFEENLKCFFSGCEENFANAKSLLQHLFQTHKNSQFYSLIYLQENLNNSNLREKLQELGKLKNAHQQELAERNGIIQDLKEKIDMLNDMLAKHSTMKKENSDKDEKENLKLKMENEELKKKMKRIGSQMISNVEMDNKMKLANVTTENQNKLDQAKQFVIQMIDSSNDQNEGEYFEEEDNFKNI